jgi:hypothetical protein
MMTCSKLDDFNKLVVEHESIVSESLDLTTAKDLHFKDYWGEVKSLGAWGGDFVMMTNDRSPEELYKYLEEKGYNICFSYDELILNADDKPSGAKHEYLH